MKNKKGVSIGRIILYIIFIFLFIAFIWSLVLTFKAMKKEPNVTNENVNSSLRMANNYDGDDIYNLYNKTLYPFQNRNNANVSTNNRGFTGCFIWLNAGTYSLSVPSDFVTTYKYGFQVADIPTWDIGGHIIYELDDYTTETTLTLTLPYGGYWGLYVASISGTSFNASVLNNFDIMFNEGQPHSYLPYNSDFVNAADYISNGYFTGNFAFQMDNYFDYTNATGYINGYMPISTTDRQGSESTFKTTYAPSIVNNNDLIIGNNIEQIYSYINNRTFSDYYYGVYHSSTYNNSLYWLNCYYECSNPIPVNYFTFTFNGSDVLSNSTTRILLNCNDDISISIDFNNNNKFTSQMVLNANPNITHIHSFGFYIYSNSYYDSWSGSTIQSDWSHIGIANRSWSTYSSFCNFHIAFDNFYGSSMWQQGYQAGYERGQADADEGLRNNNTQLQNEVNDLSSQIDELNHTLQEQSKIIRTMQDELDAFSSGQYSFKNLFWTIADTPFKTMHNVLNFDFFGVNLFRFFVGVITSLGMIWLIKKFI